MRHTNSPRSEEVKSLHLVRSSHHRAKLKRLHSGQHARYFGHNTTILDPGRVESTQRSLEAGCALRSAAGGSDIACRSTQSCPARSDNTRGRIPHDSASDTSPCVCGEMNRWLAFSNHRTTTQHCFAGSAVLIARLPWADTPQHRHGVASSGGHGYTRSLNRCAVQKIKRTRRCRCRWRNPPHHRRWRQCRPTPSRWCR